MKTTKLSVLFVICLFTFVLGCDDDNAINVDSIPVFESLNDEISSLPGQTLKFEAVINDPAGIKSVNLKYESWFLDKTILKTDSVYKTYNLSYKFKVPENAEINSSHIVEITAENVGGKTITKNVKVTLDQDITNPTIQVVSPIDGATILIGAGNEIDLNVTVADNELAEFKIESTVINETLNIEGATYNYIKSLDISEAGNYVFTITATDVSGNSQVETVSVNVLNELLFDVMYITDVTDEGALISDVFGIPYKTDASIEVDEDGYVFTAKYYSKQPNSEVRFLPQKGSFAPYTFGANPNVPGELVLGSGSDVDPIVLPEVGYYEVTMDLRNQTYTVTPYTPTDSAYDQVYVLGRGIFVGDSSTCVNNTTGATQCWHFTSGKPFVKDATNPYLWTLDITVADQPDDEGVNGFILNANPAGWSPFWRFDNAEDPEATVPGGGENYVFPDEALGKDYTMVFDTSLNRFEVTLR